MNEPLTLSDDEPLSLRARCRRDTGLAIRAAALHRFIEPHPQNTTADNIAARRGFTRTFFRYFDTKESAALPTVDRVHARPV